MGLWCHSWGWSRWQVHPNGVEDVGGWRESMSFWNLKAHFWWNISSHKIIATQYPSNISNSTTSSWFSIQIYEFMQAIPIQIWVWRPTFHLTWWYDFYLAIRCEAYFCAQRRQVIQQEKGEILPKIELIHAKSPSITQLFVITLKWGHPDPHSWCRWAGTDALME